MKKQKQNFKLNLTEKQYEAILDRFRVMYERGGVVSAEIEYLLIVMFDNDTDKVNEILDEWEFEFNE